MKILAFCDHEEHFCVIMASQDRVHHSHRCKRCLRVFEYDGKETLN